MRGRIRTPMFGWIAILALIAGPAIAQSWTGNFEGPFGGVSNAATGAVPLTGWVLADVGVRRVVIQVDGEDVGQADFGQPRPDVTSPFPGFPDSPSPGFGYVLDSTPYINGVHHIGARAELNDGTYVDLQPVHSILFQNNTHILRPFGEINRPNRNAQLVGFCDLDNPFRRPSIISGWTLDLGVETGDTGVGFVELLVDGSIIFNTRLDCRYIPELGGLTNCYGLPRLDVEHKYPFALDAPNAGFRFGLDIGALLNFGWAEGHHILTIRTGDVSNQTENVDEIPVVFICAENIGNEPSFGLIENPKLNRINSGLMTFEGWALDAQGVKRIDFYVDGIFQRSVALNPFRTRQSVTSQYPGFPDSAHPVFRAFYDSTQLSDGVHQLQVFVVDDEDAETLIGETSFITDNVPD